MGFGFRPDGVGEESLENWALFKVSKGAGARGDTGTRGGDGTSTALGFFRDKARLTESKARHHRAAADRDFTEYMNQTRQGEEAMWRSSSTPALSQTAKKKWPSLPQLVTQTGRSTPGHAGGQRGESPVPNLVKDWKFRATAP